MTLDQAYRAIIALKLMLSCFLVVDIIRRVRNIRRKRSSKDDHR